MARKKKQGPEKQGPEAGGQGLGASEPFASLAAAVPDTAEELSTHQLADAFEAICVPVPADLDAAPRIWTMDELMAEYFPGATRVSGGVAAGLQRELRRRNRLAEKGY